MNSYSIVFLFTIFGILIITGVVWVNADTNSITGEELNLSDSNPGMNETGIAYNETGIIAGNFTADLNIGNMSPVTDEVPIIYNGTEHPNEETDVHSSTPSGNPLIPKFAQGGVNIDIGVHTMEGRGTDNNVSSEISMSDHTSALGYIRTIQKDFHYMGGVDPT
ncbi:MAG: hypothetical protein CVV33_02210 [Methanomicrobiales archaeon HGW-Methanomicrobiales-4]|nr:MAG: hypothetical protein CVV33_02210 [Methanomicrobiales archaeon HGW-Methanomicrobiales-4]